VSRNLKNLKRFKTDEGQESSLLLGNDLENLELSEQSPTPIQNLMKASSQ
jgi:hypothetical protein